MILGGGFMKIKDIEIVMGKDGMRGGGDMPMMLVLAKAIQNNDVDEAQCFLWKDNPPKVVGEYKI